MNRSFHAVGLSVAGVLWAAVAAAQPAPTPTRPPQPTTSQSTDEGPTRPAATTFLGDTGLWFVPTAEVVPAGKGSASGYRRGTNYIQGYSNVGDFAGTFSVGIADRAEIFGSFLVDTRINRDTRPLFNADPAFGGIIDRYPLTNSSWSGDNLGDFFFGTKVNLMSESRDAPAALATRGIVKIPTGRKSAGVSTGKMDVSFDFIASKDAGRMVEVSGYGGYEYRGSPDGFQIPNGAFRWGGGAAFPSHSQLRAFGELSGSMPSSDIATMTSASALALDGGSAPLTSNTENLTRLTAGATYAMGKGFFVGGGASWNMPTLSRDPARASSTPAGDYWDYQIRVGFHPGVREYAAPAPASPPPPPPPPPAPAAARNMAPTLDAQCDPCTVEIGKSATVVAEGRDPDGDPLTYRWSAPAGTLADPAQRRTIWTAPQEEGTVALNVSADDGRGGTASDSIRIRVVRPATKTYTFEDIHFDFDLYSLRPETARLLDEAVAALQADATLHVVIDGHTCNIGSAEYNLALGDRRAQSVKAYLISRGVLADRLRTISYGEENPEYDNSREETRRMNRRAALVVNIAK